MSLNPRQERFVQEYLVDLNATQAAIRAGYSEATAESQGPRLLGNAKIQSAIYDGRLAQQERTQVTADKIVHELALVAFGTLDDVAPWDEDGPHLIPSKDLARDQRAMIASIKAKRERPWRGQGEDAEPWQVEHIEVKREDKMKALELLGKRFGLWDSGGNTTVNVLNYVDRAGEAAERLTPERIIALVDAADRGEVK